MSKKAIVVGAGFAGVEAAVQLARAGEIGRAHV